MTLRLTSKLHLFWRSFNPGLKAPGPWACFQGVETPCSLRIRFCTSAPPHLRPAELMDGAEDLLRKADALIIEAERIETAGVQKRKPREGYSTTTR